MYSYCIFILTSCVKLFEKIALLARQNYEEVEKGAAADGERSHQVNNGKVEQKKKEAEKQTSIYAAEKGSWASQVNTNDLPLEVFLLFAQHKNNSSENVLPLPLME